MKDQQEKTDAMQKDMEYIKINVEKVIALCEYTNNS